MKKATVRRFLAGIVTAAVVTSGLGSMTFAAADDAAASTREEILLGESSDEFYEEDPSGEQSIPDDPEPESIPEEVYSEPEPASVPEEVYSEPEPASIPEEVYSEPETVESTYSETESVYSWPESTWTDAESAADSMMEEYPGLVESTPDSAAPQVESAPEMPAAVYTPPVDVLAPTTEQALLVQAAEPVDISMNFLTDVSTGKKGYLLGSPHIYLYFEEEKTGEEEPPADPPVEPAHYLIKLTYDAASQIASGSLSPVNAGTYKVTYLTARVGQESACDAATVDTIPDTETMFRTLGGGDTYAGGTLALISPPGTVTVSETERGTLSLTSQVVRTSLTPGAYKQISGVTDTDAIFGFDIRTAGPDGKETSGAIFAAQTSGTIQQTIGQGVYFDGFTFTEPGDYYFIIRENATGKVSYFTYDTKDSLVHAKVEAQGDAFVITELTTIEGGAETQKLGVTKTTAEGVDTLAIKVTNPTATQATAATFSYELYGPIDGVPVEQSDGTYLGSKVTASLVEDGGKFVCTFNGVGTSFEGTKTYALVEKQNGTVNRAHTALIAVNSQSGANASWDIKTHDSTFTNTYHVQEAVKAINVSKSVSGSSKTTRTFTIVLKDKAGKTYTKKISGSGSDKFSIKFTKGGTYTYTVYEQKGSAAGYTYDTAQHEVKFVVTDDKKGNLVFSITEDGSPVTTPSVKFTNSYQVAVKIALINTSNRGLSNGKFRVNDSSGDRIAHWTTDGKWHTVNITKDGKYTIVETSAPSDYVKAANKTFTVENGKIKNQSNLYIKVTNELATGPFSFRKADANTGSGVAGATYTLYRIAASKSSSAYQTAASNLRAGKIVWSQMATVTSTQSGSGGGVSFGNLNPNTYYVIRETAAAPGYQKSANSVIIRTTYENDAWSSSVLMSGGNTITGGSDGYTWHEYPTRVVVVMRSSSGAYLKGAKLQLTDTVTGKVVEAWQSGSTGHEVSARMIVGRKYKLEQTNRLKGYTNSAPVTFTVGAKDAAGSSPVQYVTFTDKKNTTPTTPTSGGSGARRSGTRTGDDTDSDESGTSSGSKVRRTGSGTSSAATTSSSTTGTKSNAKAAGTGDNNPIIPLIAIMALALIVIIIVLTRRKKK